jgi:hypothetical protein
MSNVISVTDSKILFERWFERAISKLQELPEGDGGTAGLMVVLPLFERYVSILKKNSTSGSSFFEIMAADLQLTDAYQAKVFWTTFRHGFCHTGMPLARGWEIPNLPKVSLAGHHSCLPTFRTESNGEEWIDLEPWKFIQWVMDKYRNDPTLLTQHQDAPLLGIHAIISP